MGTRPTRRSRGESGYTLVEFAIAMGVFLVFMGLATPFMFSQLRSALDTERNVDVQQSARSALRTVVRELRQARFLYHAPPQKPSGKSVISFGTDLDADGQINAYDSGGVLEQVTYGLRGDRLCKLRDSATGQCQTMADGVSALSFTMFGSNPVFDANNDGTVTEEELNVDGVWTAGELANVTRVRVELTLGTGDEARTYAGDAWLRNRVIA